MADIRTMKLNLLADVSKFSTGMVKAENETKGLSTKVNKYSKAMAASFAIAGAAAATFAAKLGLDAVKAASDLNEEVSKSEVIFGNVSDEIQAFAKTADKALGLTQKEALTAASTFATFGKASGLTGKDLAKFSKGATTLASDLASFYNTDADTAILAIGAALRGESEPIRKFGVLLDDSTLKAKAMELGLYDGKGALDAQAKSLATYEVILDQTGDAQGDFSRTSDGLAGQQKILRSQIENLKTSMGENLLPVMKEVITQANFVAAAFGGKDAEGLSERARELAGTYDGQGAGSYNLGLALTNVATAFGKIFATLNSPDAKNGNTVLQSFADAINAIANALDRLSGVKASVKDFQENNVIGRALTRLDNFVLGGTPGNRPLGGRAAGGSVMAGQAYRVGEFGPELFVPSGAGSIRQDNGGQSVVINLNGIVDAESARRSIERLFQNSTRRTGALNFAGSQL